jgi:hypothetical protein
VRVPENPFASHSYSVPRTLHSCAKPGCQFAVEPSETLCEVHSPSHLRRQSDSADDE